MDELLRAAKIKAAVEGRSLRDLILEGLSATLKKPASAEPLKRANFPLIAGNAERLLTAEAVERALAEMDEVDDGEYAASVRR